MVTNMGRLLDSKPLCRWAAEHRERDLAVVMSDSLHRFVVAEGVPGLPREQFARVQVRATELATNAWLWWVTAPARSPDFLLRPRTPRRRT